MWKRQVISDKSMNGKILYIAPFVEGLTGGSLGRKNNRNAIMDCIPGCDYFIPISSRFSLNKLLLNIMGYKAGLSTNHIANILNIIERERVSIVFVDISLYGRLVYILKKRTNVVIISFFHNCEYLLYKQSRNYGKLFAKLLLSAVYNNERDTLVFSDMCVFLNIRDVYECEAIYNYKIKHFVITPIALEDYYHNVTQIKKTVPAKLLFVGSYFYPNINGLVWFINNVLPFVDYTLTIVGKGFELETFRKKLTNTDNVIFKGFVDDLTAEYESADIVIQPVFEGSGMKTKTAECLMYGKPIISTVEGFEGYDLAGFEYIYVCDSAKDFITTLKYLRKNTIPSFVPELRKIFIERYSLAARRTFYKQLLERFLYE